MRRCSCCSSTGPTPRCGRPSLRCGRWAGSRCARGRCARWRADVRRVTVLGGGPAAAELLLALRALSDEPVGLELITPEPRLALRAASTGAAFGEARVEVYDLADLAEETGATLRIDPAEAVAPAARRIRLASGASTTYDSLVLAVGARARAGIPGASVFRDHRDAGIIATLLEDLG